MKASRNEPCPCGSGAKFKQCCANRSTRSNRVATIAIGVFVVIAGWALVQTILATQQERVVPPGHVWSEEHGHFHAITGGDVPPETPVPDSAVWSEEHQHFHGPDGREITWSVLENRWLDAEGVALPGQ